MFLRSVSAVSAIFTSPTETAGLPRLLLFIFVFFLSIFCTEDVTSIQISENVSQIRSTVTGYEALSGGFKPIRNGGLFKMNLNRLYRISLLYTVTFPQ